MLRIRVVVVVLLIYVNNVFVKLKWRLDKKEKEKATDVCNKDVVDEQITRRRCVREEEGSP